MHSISVETLRDIDFDGRDVRIIARLYWNQTASFLVDNLESHTLNIKRDVEQDCTLSPVFFNVYSERIFSNAPSKKQEGMIVNEETINNLRFAVDTVLLASSQEGLLTLIDSVFENYK